MTQRILLHIEYTCSLNMEKIHINFVHFGNEKHLSY